jgi:MFS family permease
MDVMEVLAPPRDRVLLRPSSSRRLLPGLIGLSALSALDRLSVAPLLVPISRSLHTTVEAVTLAATVNFLVFGFMQVPHGQLSDAIGRSRGLRIGLLGLAVGDLVAALAHSFAVLLVGRAIAGAAAAGLVPGALVFIAEQVQPGE